MLFVTGMLRSGTTLLEKLLASHPDLSLLSQPFPYLFFDAKRNFLRTLGRDDRYPLGDLFLETAYTPADFARYLHEYRVSRDGLLAMFESMAGYSGQTTRFTPREIEAAVGNVTPGDFASTIDQLYRHLARRPAAQWHGAKETLCEEFVPYLLDRDAVCAIILRDPRDTLASLNHGRGETFTGTRKPTLFNLRQWRKSVAFALHLAGRSRFHWLRYEDLVAAPASGLEAITQSLGVASFTTDAFTHGIPDQDGGLWQGNSSHAAARSLDDSSVGSYRTVLPRTVVDYVEATCYPELTALGYPVALPSEAARTTISSYEDPYPDVREHLREPFSGPERAAEELARLSELTVPGSRYYVFDDVREKLRKALDR